MLDDQLFEDLDILGPEVKDLVNTNPKIAKALIKLGDNFKQKDHEIINKVENLSGKIIDSRKTAFPGEVISDFLQEKKNYFPKLEDFANNIFEKVQKNNRTRYVALCDFLKSEYSIVVKDVIPDEGKPFSKIYNKNKKELLLSEYNSLETKKLHAARLAADIADVPLIILARTDANAAKLITNNYDENDKPFLTGERSPEGFYYVKSGIDQAISRGLAYAPYSDLIWCETTTPNLEEAKKFADAIHKKFPGKLLAYNCSPSFNWKKHLSDSDIGTFQKKISDMGYKFQLITLAGFHTQNIAIF